MIDGHDDPHYLAQNHPILTYWDGDSEDVIPAVDGFCQGYALALLWADTYVDEGNSAWEPDYSGTYDLSYAYQGPGRWWEGIGIDFTDAIDFLSANFETLASLSIHCAPGSRLDNFGFWDCMGHDFALTRNGHGTGFWDRGFGEVGDTLTDACAPYGEHSLYVDADDKIWNE